MHKLILLTFKIISWLPLRVHYVMSDCISWVLRSVVRYRHSTVVANISRSFPLLTYKEIDEVTKEFYHNLGDVIVESVWSLSASPETIGRQVRVTGTEALNRAMALNRNAVIMVAHLGNWEIFTGLPDLRSTYGIDLDNKNFVYVYKRPASKIADKVIGSIRTRHDSCSIIESHNIVRHILRNRQGKEAFFFICDQNPPASKSSTVVDFLNQKTFMIDGPETIAMKMGMPVLYCGLIRHGRRDNEAHFELITENASECPKGLVTSKFASLLEKDINEHKGTWLWSHKRWKKRIA